MLCVAALPAFPKLGEPATLRAEPAPFRAGPSRQPARNLEHVSVSFAGDPRARTGAQQRLQSGLPLTVVAISPSSAPAHFLSRLNHVWPTNPPHTLIEVRLSDSQGETAGQLDCLPTDALHDLGAKADLLLFEPLPFAGPSYWLDIVAVERVLRSVAMSMTTPSAMMLHGIGNLKQGPDQPAGPVGAARNERDARRCPPGLAAQAWLNSSDVGLSLLAQFYGVPQISLRWMLRTGQWCTGSNGTGLEAQLAEHAANFLTRGIERRSATNGAATAAAAQGGVKRPHSWESCGSFDGLCLGWLPARTMLYRPPLSVNLTRGPTEPAHAVHPPSEHELRAAAEADRRYTAPSAQGCSGAPPVSCSSASACVSGVRSRRRFATAEIAAEVVDAAEDEVHSAADADAGLHADPGAERSHAGPAAGHTDGHGNDGRGGSADRQLEGAGGRPTGVAPHGTGHVPSRRTSGGDGRARSDVPQGGTSADAEGAASPEDAWLSGRRGVAQLGPCQGFRPEERAIAPNLLGHARAGTCTATLQADDDLLARTRTHVGSLAAWRRVVKRLDVGEELSVVVLGVSAAVKSPPAMHANQQSCMHATSHVCIPLESPLAILNH